MKQEIAIAILERASDLVIVFANTANHRKLMPEEWDSYRSAMSLLQQIGTAFEVTIDQQIIAPAVQEPDNNEEGNRHPE